MITIKNLGEVVAPGISGDLVSVIATLLTDENPPLFELGQALNSYEQSLIAAAVPVPDAPTIDPSQIAELNATIAQLQQTIEQLQLEVSPAINEITPALMAAGLLAWGNRATAGEDEAVLALVIELRDVAMAPRSIGQCDRIKDIFGEIRQRSGVDPTAAEAAAMQAILDIGPASTGPIAAKYLNFTPWL
jgi:hypothetical protein